MSLEQDIFKQFIHSMNETLSGNESKDGRDQQQLLEDLFKLEEKFRSILTASVDGDKTYKEFVEYITEEKGNILSARIYFRERQSVFSSEISCLFKDKNFKGLFPFAINYNFIRWVCDRYKGSRKKKLNNIYKKVIDLRKILCENNLPLAINRAKLFWSKTPNSHLEYMDLIQDASEGMMNAIDKFVPPYKSVFKSVAIGRMTLNMLTDHNSTVVKLSPTEKRILYRTNNAKTKEKLTDKEDILRYVSKSFKGVTSKKLDEIAAATTRVFSLDETVDDSDLTLKTTLASKSASPEQGYLSNELMQKTLNLINNLPIIEAKILKMKFGMDTP